MTVMLVWFVLSTGAAFLSTLSYLPVLYRMLRFKTTDGVGEVQCALAVVSHAGWLSLAWGVGSGMYAAVLGSAVLAMVQFVLVWRLRGVAGLTLWWSAIGVGATVYAVVHWAAVTAAIVVVIDLSWYMRAMRDVVSSVSAKAVSVWGWVMSVVANTVWVAESVRVGKALLAVQCAVMLVCAATMLWLTSRAHRRGGPVEVVERVG